MIFKYLFIQGQETMEGFPGGSVLKNPTASAGDNEFNL